MHLRRHIALAALASMGLALVTATGCATRGAGALSPETELADLKRQVAQLQRDALAQKAELRDLRNELHVLGAAQRLPRASDRSIAPAHRATTAATPSDADLGEDEETVETGVQHALPRRVKLAPAQVAPAPSKSPASKQPPATKPTSRARDREPAVEDDEPVLLTNIAGGEASESYRIVQNGKTTRRESAIGAGRSSSSSVSSASSGASGSRTARPAVAPPDDEEFEDLEAGLPTVSVGTGGTSRIAAKTSEDSSASRAKPASTAAEKLEKYRDAHQAYSRSKFSEAEVLFASWLDENPTHAEAATATYYRGDCLMRLERHDDAVRVLRDGVRRFPDDDVAPDTWARLVEALRAAGRNTEADTALRELKRRFPQSAAARSAS